MKKVFIILSSLVALVLLLAVAAISYVLTFDPNENKDWITSRFKAETGRDLVLNGDIGFTIYPWLGLTLNDVSISNAEGFSATPLLQAEHADVRIKLMPLLNDAWEIDTIRLHGAHLDLEVLDSGANNWTLTTGDAPDDAANEPGAGMDLSKLIVGGVDIQDVSMVYDNQLNATHYEVSNLNLTIGDLVYGEPLDIRMSLDASSRAPELDTAVNLEGVVVYDVDNGRYNLDPLALQGSLRGPDVPTGSADISLETALDIDLEEETLSLSALEVTALGTSLSANVDASDIRSDTPAFTASLNLRGDDLAALFRILEQDALVQRISSLNSSFDITASLDADMASGTVNIPDLRVSLLGADISGNLAASGTNSETPAFNGSLTASGPDLPTLMEVAGMLQGGSDSAVSEYGRKLSRVTDRSFRVQTEFDADMARGSIQLPALTASMLGFRLNGNLDAQNMQDSNGAVSGALQLQGENLNEILTALGQPDLAEVAQSLTLDVEVNGDRRNLRLSPMNLGMRVAGPQIANGPQTLALNADTMLNLDNDSLRMDAFSLAGLGLNVNGSFNASNISENASFEGRLEMQPFNARQLLQQLNLDVPQTADSSTLQSIALTTAFSGTANSMDLRELSIVLDDSRITGALAVTDFSTRASRFDVNVDRIDVDRYLAPADASDADPGNEEADPLPVDMLKTLDVQGGLEIGELTISGLRMRDIAVQVAAVNGDLALDPVSANLYDGSIAAGIHLNVNGPQPAVAVATNLTTINLEPLLQDFMDATWLTGNGNIELALNGSGNDAAAILGNLNGNGRINLEQGVLNGVDVADVLGRIETMIRERRLVELPQGGQTPFDNFSATLAINEGVVGTQDLLIEAPGWRLTGAGTLVDLANDTIDFNMLTTVVPETVPEGQQYTLSGNTLPIACTGSISSPRCLPDAQAIITAAVGNAVQRRLGEFLQDRLGTSQTGEETRPDETAPDDTAPPDQDPAEEVINRALERLLQ